MKFKWYILVEFFLVNIHCHIILIERLTPRTAITMESNVWYLNITLYHLKKKNQNKQNKTKNNPYINDSVWYNRQTSGLAFEKGNNLL